MYQKILCDDTACRGRLHKENAWITEDPLGTTLELRKQCELGSCRDEEIYGKRTKGNEEGTEGNEEGTGRYESRIIKENRARPRRNQERTRRNEEGQEKMKNKIQSHVESKVGENKYHVNSWIERIEEDVQSVKREIGDVKGEVERKIEQVEDNIQGKIEEVKEKIQVKIGDLEKRLSELEDRPINFPANPELMFSRPTVKSLAFDEQTSWTVFKTHV
ncbi:hypothetical protein AVEN_146555-1 [Araneus ventricosus]|uniref:Uncharacterized protein n=1 Tax=Araneus ventricosus TaxID=182803 RepID=A0A4Y2X548_ARAVE|nr:hypothetical protein AVEN_146555-1 [Araneus ventricosus]